MALFEFSADVECTQCGAQLEADMKGPNGTVMVEPCDACLDEEFNRGLDSERLTINEALDNQDSKNKQEAL